MPTNVEFDLQQYLTDMEGRIVDAVKVVGGRVDHVEERVEKLEKWRNYLAGAWAAVFAAGSYVVKGTWTQHLKP